MTTIAKLLEKFKAPNDADNCTITQAVKHQQMLTHMGLGFDSIFAIQGTSPMAPEDEIDIATILSMKGDQNTPLYLVGRYKRDQDSKGYTIAFDLSEIENKDGFDSFIYLWTDRNHGGRVADAVAAATNIPAAHDAIGQALDAIRNEAR